MELSGILTVQALCVSSCSQAIIMMAKEVALQFRACNSESEKV